MKAELRLVDDTACANPACIAARNERDGLRKELKHADSRLGVAQRQIARLKEEQASHREMSPFAPQAERVFEHWKQRVRPGAKEFGPARLDAVLSRLEAGYSAEELCIAVEGAGLIRDGAVDWSPRNPTSHLDLSNICKDPESVDRFMAYVDQGARRHGSAPALPHELQHVDRNLLRRCDCGHFRFEHSLADPGRHGFEGCLVRGCECIDFDDIDRRADEWLDEQRRRRAA